MKNLLEIYLQIPWLLDQKLQCDFFYFTTIIQQVSTDLLYLSYQNIPLIKEIYEIILVF